LLYINPAAQKITASHQIGDVSDYRL
jgi:hypothetical protein